MATEDSATLDAELHKPFEIVLASKVMSGYEWQPRFNGGALRLVNKRINRPNTKAFGASGHVVFKFEPLKAGVHGITFDLVRPFEGDAVASKAFALHVR